MIEIENKLDNFLLPQIPTSQPLILCFVLLDPESSLVFNNSLLKCKYLLGVVKPYRLIVDCCMSIGSCFNGVRMAEEWGLLWTNRFRKEREHLLKGWFVGSSLNFDQKELCSPLSITLLLSSEEK